MQRPIHYLSTEAYKKLLTYDYPGNIRQLGNILEYAVAMAKDSIFKKDLLIAVPNEYGAHSPVPANLMGEKKVIEIGVYFYLGNAIAKIYGEKLNAQASVKTTGDKPIPKSKILDGFVLFLVRLDMAFYISSFHFLKIHSKSKHRRMDNF